MFCQSIRQISTAFIFNLKTYIHTDAQLKQKVDLFLQRIFIEVVYTRLLRLNFR